jgi:hypothetical protein
MAWNPFKTTEPLPRNNIRELAPTAPAPAVRAPVSLPILPPTELPEGVDLAALWEEPDASGGFGTIISIASGVVSLITLLVVLFLKH